METRLAAVAGQIGAACRDNGFFYVSGHGIDAALIDDAFRANARFHALPLEEKLRVKLNAWHRGYQTLGGSKLTSSARFPAARLPNQLESFFVRHEVPQGHPDLSANKPLQGPNQWPADPWFKEVVERYELAVRTLGLRLLPAIATALGQDPAFFAPHFTSPNTALRLIHYPPTPKDRPDDLFGANQHTDYGFITILSQDAIGGLEVLNADRSWLPVVSIPGTFVINIGDMLARWTNDRFQSTPHRVVNASTERDRYSIAYFFDPNLKTVIRCMPGLADPGEGERYEPVVLSDYVSMRLNANYQDRKTQ